MSAKREPRDVLERICDALDQIVALLEKKWDLSVGVDHEWPDGTRNWVAQTRDEVDEMFEGLIKDKPSS